MITDVRKVLLSSFVVLLIFYHWKKMFAIFFDLLWKLLANAWKRYITNHTESVEPFEERCSMSCVPPSQFFVLSVNSSSQIPWWYPVCFFSQTFFSLIWKFEEFVVNDALNHQKFILMYLKHWTKSFCPWFMH